MSQPTERAEVTKGKEYVDTKVAYTPLRVSLPRAEFQEPLAPRANSSPFDGTTFPRSKSMEDLIEALTDAERAAFLRRVQELLEITDPNKGTSNGR